MRARASRSPCTTSKTPCPTRTPSWRVNGTHAIAQPATVATAASSEAAICDGLPLAWDTKGRDASSRDAIGRDAIGRLHQLSLHQLSLHQLSLHQLSLRRLSLH
ncbi:hypothetical protein ACILG0_13495 [Pseudomonadota bacterium AL_CKDN230030165-1A_HGKHYDSX7]